MITKKTVFIIGAGGSYPYGFPLGEGLVKKIIENLSTAQKIEELVNIGFEEADIKTFQQRLKGANLRSIDAFLEHQNSELQALGKAAIAQELLKSCAYTSVGADDWYKEIWNKMFTSQNQLKNNLISFITFNYDLSLEHYLYKSVCSSFDIAKEDADEILNSFKFIHVHGKIGNAPWEKGYKAKVSIKEAAKGIKIISEDLEKEEGFNQAQILISDSQRIYFIGFGYHGLNLARLKINLLKSGKDILGNSYGFTSLERTEIDKMIDADKPSLCQYNGYTNVNFIREHVKLN